MAGSFNKVMLMGNLTRDVEVRHTSNNQAVANFGLAVNRKFKAGDGQMREDVTFVDCEAWGRTGENVGKFFAKGRPIFVEGRLRLNQWQDREGNNRSKLLVVVESFEFVDSRSESGGGGGGGGRSYDSGGGGNEGPPMEDDDIPF